MKKTFDEILTEILTAKSAEPALATLTSTSKTAIWRKIMEVVAWAIYIFQSAVELHLKEINELIANQKTFNLRRYRSEALRFQYGFDLVVESDQFRPDYQEGGSWIMATPEKIEQSKVVKYAACSRVFSNDGKVRIIMKIAPENLDETFSNDVMTAFGNYIEEVQPAGDRVTIVNYLPDLLDFWFRIKYDPQVLTSTGMHIITAKFPVKEAIERFLKNDMPFNGELSIQRLEDAIRNVEGVLDLQTKWVETCWIDPALNDYGLFQPVNMSVIPVSGRFKVHNFNNLTFEA